jgi:hypothetical protein
MNPGSKLLMTDRDVYGPSQEAEPSSDAGRWAMSVG